MKRREVMELNKSEYASKITELRKELIKLNAQASSGAAMKNPGLIRQAKRNIARILTLQKNTEVAKKE